ncbi:MAG: cytochrome c biogenesis protein CcdA [Candidatus Niyogibacteria bacterium]|nr:cytochrome c biogenesis protein CcdA [Candidatus Niyogibacteria bacterium]
MDILIGTSLVAAFVAGITALFAPCCITVLLPSYLANVFREKYKIFFMTFIFFMGIATVFLPIGLGASFLAQLFGEYHNLIFTAGGIILVVLGLTMLAGKKFAIPAPAHSNIKRSASSVYLLGIFSAIATTCCAPVLAGVLALSVASGTIVWGGLYTLAYVVGMTLPLFVIAALLDKVDLTGRLLGAKQTVALKIGNLNWQISISELISGSIFLLMGGYITYLAFAGKLYSHSDYQLDINLYSARFLNYVNGFVGMIPEYLWALLFIGIIAYAVRKFINQYNNYEPR